MAAALICFVNLNVLAVDSPSQVEKKNSLKDTWGIQVKTLSLSAGGNLVDFRYQVTDPAKAVSLSKKEASHPYLVDQDTGAVLRIPGLAQIGSLRTSMKNPIAGKTYFMLFSNPGMVVKKSDKMTLVIGDLRTENIMVE
jgi:hypothetical protein